MMPWLWLACGAQAQVATDAGALQQRIERERQTTLPPRATPAAPSAPALKPPTTGRVLEVKAFAFRGNHLLSDQLLSAAVSGYLNRPLDFTQLQAAAAAVAAAYRNAGWVVDAYLPAQDIRDGRVTIEVVEAVFGSVRIEGEPKRVRAQRLVAIVAAQQAHGQPVKADALDRAVLLADDLPGVAVSGALRAGDGPAQTDLVFKVADDSAFSGDARLDNTGARSTGSERVAANLYLNSPSGAGDQVGASIAASEGSRYARLAYDLPVGFDGWRVGANASYFGYQLKDAPGEGSSQGVGLEARYPLVRARMVNLFLVLNADHKAFDNSLNGVTTTRYQTDVASVALFGNQFDDLGGGGANSAALTVASGRRNNEQGTTDGSFNKLRYAASRQQRITPSLSAYVGVDGQHSQDVLDTSESFYLGGLSGVRAYPSNEGRGSSGELVKLELRWRTLDNLSTALFYDHGRVRNRDGSPSYSLQGVGLSLAWQAAADVNLSVTLARRVGTNPHAGLTGRDEDGSLTKNRVWLAGNWAF